MTIHIKLIENGKIASSKKNQRTYHDEWSNTKKVNLIRLWLQNGFSVDSNNQFFVITSYFSFILSFSFFFSVFYLQYHELLTYSYDISIQQRYEFNCNTLTCLSRISLELPLNVHSLVLSSVCFIVIIAAVGQWILQFNHNLWQIRYFIDWCVDLTCKTVQ